MLKTCTRCQLQKESAFFNKNKSKPDGLNTRCRLCDSEHNKEWYAANKERRLVTQRQWAESNRENIRAATARYRASHPEKVAAYKDASKDKMAEYHKHWFEANKSIKQEKNRLWAKLNPAKHAALRSRRRASERLPAWASKEAIERMYRVARRVSEVTGVKHHVDHIIPLRGKRVSGLHVETNMRVIAADQNWSKNNRFTEA